MFGSPYFILFNLVYFSIYLAQIVGTRVTVEPEGPIVAGVGTNKSIHFRMSSDGEPFIIGTHVDHAYFDFPPNFIREYGRGHVLINSAIEADGSMAADFHLTHITEDFSGRYGVRVEIDEFEYGPSTYVELIVPAANWKPRGFIVARVGESISMQCSAIEYASLVASTSFNAGDITVSPARRRRATSDIGPNPVVTLNVSIASVTEADMGRYACTSRDRNDPEIETTEYLELLVMKAMTTGSVITIQEQQHASVACWLPWLDESLQSAVWYQDYKPLTTNSHNEIDIDNDGIPDAMTSYSGRWLIFLNANMGLSGDYQCQVQFAIPQQGGTIYHTPFETISLKVTRRKTSESNQSPPCESWEDYDLSQPSNAVVVTDRDNDFRWSMRFRVKATELLNITISDASWVDPKNRFEVLMGVRNEYGNSFTVVERYENGVFNEDEHRKYVITPDILSDDPDVWDEFTLEYYYDTIRILKGISQSPILTYNNFQQSPTFTRFFADFTAVQTGNDTEVQLCVREDFIDPTPIVCDTENCANVSAGIRYHTDILITAVVTLTAIFSLWSS